MKIDLSDIQYRVLVGAGLVLLALIIARARFCGVYEFPNPPAPPEINSEEATAVARELEHNQQIFQQYLFDDSKLYRVVPPATIESMSKPLAYVSVTEPQTLRPGEELTLAGLEMHLVKEDIPSQRRKQIVLEIKNLQPYPVAYKIKTKPERAQGVCSRKRDLPHNAIALQPGQTARRSECIYNEKVFLTVESIETLQLSELGYYYLTAVEPARFGMDRRTRAGHQRGDHRGACNLIQSAKMTRKIENGEIRWRDLVDFYARHRCQTYSFPDKYHMLTGKESERVPVSTPKE